MMPQKLGKGGEGLELYSENNGRYMDDGIPNKGDLKKKQLEIILKHNPANDDYHTWIRNENDIKTFEESLNDSDYVDYDEFNPDWDRSMANEALESGFITVYSSYPIEQGIFVSPSKMEAQSYSGNGRVYSKRVPIDSIAWIDPTQGQYAYVGSENKNNLGQELSPKQVEYFKDSKMRDENGNLKVMYRGDNEDFDVFDRSKMKKSGTLGNGFYFTTESTHGGQYGKVKEYYLNIKNPLSTNEKTFTKQQLIKLIDELPSLDEDFDTYNFGQGVSSRQIAEQLMHQPTDFTILRELNYVSYGNFAGLVELTNEILGTNFDGIITDTETIVFNPNQIKLIDNLNPTESDSISDERAEAMKLFGL